MKGISSLILVLFSTLMVAAQAVSPTPTPVRPRVFASSPTPTPTPYNTPAPYNTPKAANIIITSTLPPAPTPTPHPTFSPTPAPVFGLPAVPNTNPTQIYPPPAPTPVPTPIAYKLLSYTQLRAKIEEAKRLMQSRPMPTAMTDSFLATDVVRLAFYDWTRAQIDFIDITKSVFLSRAAEIPTVSESGKQVRLIINRANGVNTAVTIFDTGNQAQTPLVVQYPIEKRGSFAEMAYYISSHPGLATPEVVSAGKFYVHNTLDIARDRLRQKGIFIAPQVADVAERLSTVEHIDHQRFWSEYQPNLFNEIFSLYALNEGNTFRYSVSSAGAGGMVQMIPSTYFMLRNRYYNANLIPDFVEGMRNHVNAAEAMLLYMQMTWNDLTASETILTALSNGTATQAELLAAGYNSNPAKLPGYINRGGANWKALIPGETKIYLQIYSSLERAVPMPPRIK